jgi:hypothetical protein
MQSSTGYIVTPQKNGFAVTCITPSNVRITRFTQEGEEVVERRPVTEVIPGYQDDVFWTYCHNGEWHTDINCGAQRWRGIKTTNQIRAALRKCGFTAKEIREIMQCGKELVGKQQ